MLLRQLSYTIKNQLKAPKAPTRDISCLSLVLYGIRIGSKLTVLTFVVLLPLFPHRGGAEGLLVHPVGVVVPPAAPLPLLLPPPVVAVVAAVAESHVLPLKLRTSLAPVLLLLLLVQLHLLLQA